MSRTLHVQVTIIDDEVLGGGEPMAVTEAIEIRHAQRKPTAEEIEAVQSAAHKVWIRCEKRLVRIGHA